MPRYKSLLKPLEVVDAGRKRKCYHDPNHQISKGDICLEVTEGLTTRGYCRTCAQEMIVSAATTLGQIKGQL